MSLLAFSKCQTSTSTGDAPGLLALPEVILSGIVTGVILRSMKCGSIRGPLLCPFVICLDLNFLDLSETLDGTTQVQQTEKTL